MFFEFTTKRNEKVIINICRIHFVTSRKIGSLIMDLDGNEFETLESYDSVISRLKKFKCLKCDKSAIQE